MAVKLRLSRMGRKKRPYYRIVAVDERRKRDGAYLERIGLYHPLEAPAAVIIDAEKALKWLRVGAQPSDTVRSLLRRQGIWHRFHLEKRGVPEADLNRMMNEWFAAHRDVVEPPAKEASAPPPAVAAPVEAVPPPEAQA